MKIAIRTDASIAIGTGHVMRCLTLGRELRTCGDDVTFISRELPGNLCDICTAAGFRVLRLPATASFDAELDALQTAEQLGNGADWLIVDHYGVDAAWERRLRSNAGRIMVIDDLADRSHECDLLLDQNLFADMPVRYARLVPDACRLFLGPSYALLRDEFIAARRTLRQRNGVVARLLVFFGGSDPTSETAKALAALQLLQRPDLHVEVVIGATNPHGTAIAHLCAAIPNVTLHRQVSTMASLMAAADLAVGAGGTTTWERCFLGLPALVVTVAGNQVQPARAAANCGAIRLAGDSSGVTADTLAAELRSLLVLSDEMSKMSRCCFSIMGERTGPVHGEIMEYLRGIA